MKSALKEEKKIDMNEIPNLTLKKLKINKHNSTNNIFTQSQKGFYALHKNKKFIKSNKKKTNSFGYTNENSINLRDKNYKNFYKTLQPIRNQLIKISKKNKKNETNLINSKLNLYKSTFIGKFEKINNNKINSNQNANSNINGSQENKLLYEDIIKLKTRINKLKMEYSFIKSLTRKKDEEIRELEKYKEEAKYYYGKNDRNLFFEKLKYLKEIVDLKNKYEEIKIKLRKQKDDNNTIINQIKSLNIAELKKKVDEKLKQLKKNVEEFNKIRKINEELEEEISKTSVSKDKFMENHKFLIKLKLDYSQKKLLIKIMEEKLEKLKQKSENINSQKARILRRNSSIKSDNKKLLKERKKRQDYLIQQIEIEKKISSYEAKTMNLKNETTENEINIDKYSQKRNIEPLFRYNTFLERNPYDNKEKKEMLYESLINDSKKKQNDIIEKIRELMEENIKNRNNKMFNKIKIVKNSPKKLESTDMNNITDNSQLFGNNLNHSIKDIKIEEEKDEIIIKNNNEILFLLNIMFYLAKIKKEKIKGILLNYKTENYYVKTLSEKNSFLTNLTTEILQTINNKKDINNLKEVLLYLLENKYKNNEILFLNEAINDIFLLENQNKILFNKTEEKTLLEKIQNIFSEKDIQSKLNKIQDSIISYENLKSLLIKQKIFDLNENNEQIKYFQFFIYIIKKKESYLKKHYSLKEFDIKNILEILDELKPKPKEDI
jgi:hypothetical protein